LLAVGEVQNARRRPLGDDEKKTLSELEAIHKELKPPQRSSDTIRIRESKRDQDTWIDFTVNERVIYELVAMVHADQDAIELLEKEIKHMKGIAEN
jgi:hypothetical protein